MTTSTQHDPEPTDTAAAVTPTASGAALDTTPEPDRRILASAPMWRAMLHLALPMVAGMSVGVVYDIVNAGFVGALHDTALLAALAYAVPVFALAMAIGGVFGVGGSTAVSRALGAEGAEGPDAAPRDPAAVRRALLFTFWGAIGAGIVIGALCLVLLQPIVALLGADGATTAPTAIYAGIMFAFLPVFTTTFAAEQLVRAGGAAVASMTGLIASTVANLVFDVLFIVVLDMGVAGAALALGLSNLVALGYYAWFLQRRSGLGSLWPRGFSFRPAREVLSVGSSELLMSLFLMVSAVLLNTVATKYGAGAIAAFGVAQRVVRIPELFTMGISMGLLPLFAYARGANDTDRLRRAVRAAAIAIAGSVLLFATPVYLLREQVFGLFTDDATLASTGATVLVALLVATLVNGFTGLVIAVFQATGRGAAAATLSIAQGVLFIGVLFAGDAIAGFTGVVWAMTVTEFVVVAVGLVLLVAQRRAVFGPAIPAVARPAATA